MMAMLLIIKKDYDVLHFIFFLSHKVIKYFRIPILLGYCWDLILWLPKNKSLTGNSFCVLVRSEISYFGKL